MQSAEERAASAGLRYVDPERLPLRRRRSGSGFTYVDQHSRSVSDTKVKQRVARLAIPPAWKDVRIARDPRSHIQAVGRDAAGRLQYRYQELWTEGGHEVKLKRLIDLGAGLGKLRADVEAQLRRQTVDADFTLACAVALIDRAGLRIGYPEYARDDGGRGAATLRRSDVTIRDGKVRLRFNGKGGKDIQRIVDDAQLARALARLREQPGDMLFRWRDQDGDDACLNADKVNVYLRKRIGEETSARDFRTFRASAIVTGWLQEAGDSDAAGRKPHHAGGDSRRIGFPGQYACRCATQLCPSRSADSLRNRGIRHETAVHRPQPRGPRARRNRTGAPARAGGGGGGKPQIIIAFRCVAHATSGK